MSQSLCKIYLHIIFHIKTSSPCILDDDLDRVHAYIGQLVNDANCLNIWVDGTGDHVHVLCLLGREISIANLLETFKRNSSRWIKSLSPHYSMFTPIRDKIAISCMLRQIHEFSSHAIRHGLYIKNRKRLFCP